MKDLEKTSAWVNDIVAHAIESVRKANKNPNKK